MCPSERYAKIKWQLSYGWHGYYDELNAFTQTDQLSFRNLARLRMPAGCFMHAETDNISIHSAGNDSNEDFRICRKRPKLIDEITLRHGVTGINVSYCDGHVTRENWNGYTFPMDDLSVGSSTYNLWIPY